MFSKEKITKLQAAERQLNESIQLFFENRDPLAIHTLASASHEILYQLGKNKGVKGILKNPDLGLIKDGRWKEWCTFLNKNYNFLKHARCDPKEVIEFPSESNVFRILDCVWIYNHLTENSPHAHKVWMVWFNLKYPGILKKGDFKKSLDDVLLSGDPDDLDFFLRLILRAS